MTDVKLLEVGHGTLDPNDSAFFGLGRKSAFFLVLRIIPLVLKESGINDSDAKKVIKNLTYRLP